MMSPKPTSEDRYSVYSRQTPLRIIHFTGNFMRIWSIYSMYHYLSQSESSVVLYIFSCLVPSSIMFLVLQKPWRGRPLSNTQIVPSVINGAITALYFILWVKGVKACGPLRAILAEYSGAVLGVLSAVLYGRRGHIWKKVGGLIAMIASLYFLSQGWAMATYSPFSSGENLGSDAQKEKVLGMREMAVPMLAGILSAFRRVIARRISIKNQLKRRLHAITIASATCFMFPVAMWDVILGTAPDSNRDLPFSTWPYISTILFGVILISYVENIAEERLHMVFSSPKHLMVAGGCIIVLEILYKMDFSLAGFIICCALLGFGIYEATSLERPRRDHQTLEPSENLFEEDQIQMSSLPT
ncbi:zinc transporter 5-like [Chenopodium quinoa]|uniref:zinc transporter 5-like n=1 Tax=Chenopodium quinoa TaxID=63459 RepID=UPI000B76D25F|nr:zinc transporter 5-like [Chenopodium quinoa]XP_021763568.1 zinc transporter 5-like [Chenopodium quinoa]